MKRRFKNTIYLAGLIAAAVCCNKVDSTNGEDDRVIVLSPVTQQPGTSTKGALYQEGALSEDYTIYLSSYFVNETSDRGSGNYFVCTPFNKRSERWCAEPAVYWPFGGYINLLAVACKDTDYSVSDNVTWDEADCTRGAIIRVPSGDCMQSEILFAKASSRKASQKTIDLVFEHTQTWLQFGFSCEEDSMVRLEGVVINKAYTGGLFTINNLLFTGGEWSFRGFFRENVSVPGASNLIVNRSKVYCNMLLPEQDACDITFYYRQKTSREQSWDDAPLSQYVYSAEHLKWFYGIRNVFDVKITPTGISLSVSVKDWSDSEIKVYLTPTEPDMVDLGLPSGLKWSKTNIGAMKETDPGLYFKWGESIGHTAGELSHFDDSYPSSFSDAAMAAYGKDYRVPTVEDISELINYTEQEVTTLEGVRGVRYSNMSNPSRYIFIPFAGYCANGTFRQSSTNGYMWSSTVEDEECSYAFFNYTDGTGYSTYARSYGMSVRAVQE